MPRRLLLVTLSLASMVFACRPAVRVTTAPDVASASMRLASGQELGTLTLEARGTSLRISGTLKGLTAGIRGIHIHEVGRCDAPEFVSAGPHHNPTSKKHGLEIPQGPHAGDLPNIVVDGSGQASVNVMPVPSSTGAALAELLDADGAAVVIHAGPDDQRTDPAGNSGARIACGVIVR